MRPLIRGAAALVLQGPAEGEEKAEERGGELDVLRNVHVREAGGEVRPVGEGQGAAIDRGDDERELGGEKEPSANSGPPAQVFACSGILTQRQRRGGRQGQKSDEQGAQEDEQGLPGLLGERHAVEAVRDDALAGVLPGDGDVVPFAGA